MVYEPTDINPSLLIRVSQVRDLHGLPYTTFFTIMPLPVIIVMSGPLPAALYLELVAHTISAHYLLITSNLRLSSVAF